jgi:hypothetical protein
MVPCPSGQRRIVNAPPEDCTMRKRRPFVFIVSFYLLAGLVVVGSILRLGKQVSWLHNHRFLRIY